MEKGLKKNKKILIIMNSILILYAIVYTVIMEIVGDSVMPEGCLLKPIINFYCPGCGGTRSLSAFLHFDFISSFILYPPIIVSFLVILDYDRRLITTLIKKNTEKTDSFRFYTFILIPVSVILTFIIRNILLLCFKIDTIGDFIP